MSSETTAGLAPENIYPERSRAPVTPFDVEPLAEDEGPRA